MAVGVLLLTHDGIGQSMIAATRGVVGPMSLRVASLAFNNGDDVDAFQGSAGRALVDLDSGEGVLVLTDLYGATPSNVGARLATLGVAIRRVSGLNLPMLLRVLNYADQPLDELAQIAAGGARNGVVLDTV
jgi:PTS system mannose-specific IIA component